MRAYMRFQNVTKTLTWMLLLVSVMYHASAQQVILNTVGERIVIYPDGSWRYYEDADSVLLGLQLKKEDVFLQGDDTVDPFTKPRGNADDIEDQLRMAIQFTELTTNAVREATVALSKATNSKFEIETQLQQAVENKNLVEPDRIATLEDDLKQQTATTKQARKHLKQLEKYAARAQDVVDMKAKRRGTALNKLMVEYNAYTGAHATRQTSASREPVVVVSAPDTSRNAGRGGTVGQDGVVYTGNEMERISSYRRRNTPCTFAEQQVDMRNKEVKLVVQRALLFTHTDDELRPYFRQQELITCSGQLTRIDDNVFFSVEFSIASPNARKNFGSLERGSLMRIRLLDNTDIDLYNRRADRGQIDPYTGNTLFTGQYLLEKEAMKALGRSEADKMRVVWSAGYEDYDIYEVDFFMDQLTCLNSL